MEDAHSFVYDFAAIKGQGYFAVFDGHAGKHAAEWCGQNFHEVRPLPKIVADGSIYSTQSFPLLINLSPTSLMRHSKLLILESLDYPNLPNHLRDQQPL